MANADQRFPGKRQWRRARGQTGCKGERGSLRGGRPMIVIVSRGQVSAQGPVLHFTCLWLLLLRLNEVSR